MTTHARRTADPVSPGRISNAEYKRRQDWGHRSPQEILARLQPGRADPLKVLDTLIELFNTQHTARRKTVSHKTRVERAQFLHRFFRDLQEKAGFRTLPDPRCLGQKHIQAMAHVWRNEQLAPATIQTYFSFLRGLASWLGKPGFIRSPAFYGFTEAQYKRHEDAQEDKSWSAHGIDVEDLLAKVAEFDPRISASMRLMHTLGLRRKESVMFRPQEHVQPFERTGLPPEERKADDYVWTKGKGGRARWVPVETAQQRAAVDLARSQATSHDAHMGDPALSLKRNLGRLDYALRKFGITKKLAGTTGHGSRHGRFNDKFEDVTGVPSPVRGGDPVPADLDRKARLIVAALAGHSRLKASSAYVGKSGIKRTESRPQPPATDAGASTGN